jgi:hypothetical protein
MGVRIPLYKIIAIPLILSLLGVGAVPAQTLCDGSCNCHPKGSGHGVVSHFLASQSGSLHRKATHHLLQGPRLTSFSQIDFLDLGCHEGMTPSCDMEAAQDRNAIQGSMRAVPWSGNSSTGDSILFVSVIQTNEHHAFGITASHWLIGKRAPDPLYLQHLSLLC